MLTKEEQAASFHTMLHIRLVGKLLHRVASELLLRADNHDQSKIESPEVQAFSKAAELEHMTYGSEEYNKNKEAIKDALIHHYARNQHHPEYWKNGVNDMSLIDLIEMICDWKASSTRHADGNIRKSIEINANRFGISPQLVKILENTVDLFDDVKGDVI